MTRKYRLRERRRVHDELHKITKGLSNRTNVFEGLKGFKERVARTKSKSVNRQNSKHDYLTLMEYVEYKAGWNGYATFYVDARGTSKACSKCGYYDEDLKGSEGLQVP